jgi:hypothetical protein
VAALTLFASFLDCNSWMISDPTFESGAVFEAERPTKQRRALAIAGVTFLVAAPSFAYVSFTESYVNFALTTISMYELFKR